MGDLVTFLSAALAVLALVEVRLKLAEVRRRVGFTGAATLAISDALRVWGLSSRGEPKEDVAKLVTAVLDDFVFVQRNVRAVRYAEVSAQIALSQMAALLTVCLCRAARVNPLQDVLDLVASAQHGFRLKELSAGNYAPLIAFKKAAKEYDREWAKARFSEREEKLLLVLRMISGSSYGAFEAGLVNSRTLLKLLFLSGYLRLPSGELTDQDKRDLEHLRYVLPLLGWSADKLTYHFGIPVPS